MFYVESLKTTREGTQVVMGRAVLDPDTTEVRFEGIPQNWVEEMQRDAINIGGGGWRRRARGLMASQGIPSWNQVLDWLRNMDLLRQTA